MKGSGILLAHDSKRIVAGIGEYHCVTGSVLRAVVKLSLP
jgi:hypothetical protein